jgi:hypothetical protein
MNENISTESSVKQKKILILFLMIISKGIRKNV